MQRPGISKVFTTSEAVDDALARYLGFAREANVLTRCGRTRKHQAS
jgi:hypothetical protein